jgi:RNA polymerase sigma-70 factor (ECF subfamily)
MANERDDHATLKKDLLALIPRLRRFAYSLTGSMNEGDDLAQIALERALMRLDQWRPGTRLDSWVFRIAQNAWIDELRARKRRGGVADIEAAAELMGDDGRAVLQGKLDLAEVRAAMDILPDEQRAVIALVAIEGHSYQEAADILDVQIGTVMSRLSRARQALVNYLRQKERRND